MDQSEFDPAPNAGKRVAWLVLIWLLIGWLSCASFINQSQSAVKQNKSKRELFSTLDEKGSNPDLPLSLDNFCSLNSFSASKTDNSAGNIHAQFLPQIKVIVFTTGKAKPWLFNLSTR